jgi:hypothetical protein
LASLISIIIDLLIVIAIPTVIVLVLTLSNRNSKQILVATYGFSSQVVFGFLGIIIHETSHMLVAFLFGHQIVAFKPLVFPKNVAQNGGALGYVKQRWNPNSLYQSFGNLFIGTAPIWGCTLALYWLTKITMPNLFAFMIRLGNAMTTMNLDKVLAVVKKPNLFLNASVFDLLIALIGLVAMTNIVIGGFDLSSNDLNNAFGAFIAFFIVIAVILSALVFFGLGNVIRGFLIKLMAKFISLMSLSIILSFLVNISLRFLNFLARLRN